MASGRSAQQAPAQWELIAGAVTEFVNMFNTQASLYLPADNPAEEENLAYAVIIYLENFLKQPRWKFNDENKTRYLPVENPRAVTAFNDFMYQLSTTNWRNNQDFKMLLPQGLASLKEDILNRRAATLNEYWARLLIKEDIKPDHRKIREHLEAAQTILSDDWGNDGLIAVLIKHGLDELEQRGKPEILNYALIYLQAGLWHTKALTVAHPYLALVIAKALKKENPDPNQLTLARQVLRDPALQAGLILELQKLATGPALAALTLQATASHTSAFLYEDNDAYQARIERLLQGGAEQKETPAALSERGDKAQAARLRRFAKPPGSQQDHEEKERKETVPAERQPQPASPAPTKKENTETTETPMTPTKPVEPQPPSANLAPAEIESTATAKPEGFPQKGDIVRILEAYKNKKFLSSDRRTNVENLLHQINTATDQSTISPLLDAAHKAAEDSDTEVNSSCCRFFFRRNLFTFRYREALNAARQCLGVEPVMNCCRKPHPG